MTNIRNFFSNSDWLDHEVFRPLSHIRSNWELRWDNHEECYEVEEDSYADLMNELITELENENPPQSYHDNEDLLAEAVRDNLKWDIRKEGNQWVNTDGSRICPSDYLAVLEQGGHHDIQEKELVMSAAGRLKAAMSHGQNHFDEMERSHQYILAGVLAIILYHRGC